MACNCHRSRGAQADHLSWKDYDTLLHRDKDTGFITHIERWGDQDVDARQVIILLAKDEL